MSAGNHGQVISADLVSCISVSGDSVRPYQHEIDLSVLHEHGGHGIADQRCRHPPLEKFPHGQPSPLEQRPGFVGVHVYFFTLRNSRIDNPEGSSDPTGSKGPGVAMGENAGRRGDQRGTPLANRLAHLAVFAMNSKGFLQEGTPELEGRGGAQGFGPLPHSVESPEQIDGCRPGSRQVFGVPLHAVKKLGGGGGLPPRPKQTP